MEKITSKQAYLVRNGSPYSNGEVRKSRVPRFYVHAFKPEEKGVSKSVSLNMFEAFAFLGFRYEHGIEKLVLCSDEKKRKLVIVPFRIIMNIEEDGVGKANPYSYQLYEDTGENTPVKPYESITSEKYRDVSTRSGNFFRSTIRKIKTQYVVTGPMIDHMEISIVAKEYLLETTTLSLDPHRPEKKSRVWITDKKERMLAFVANKNMELSFQVSQSLRFYILGQDERPRKCDATFEFDKIGKVS